MGPQTLHRRASPLRRRRDAHRAQRRPVSEAGGPGSALDPVRCPWPAPERTGRARLLPHRGATSRPAGGRGHPVRRRDRAPRGATPRCRRVAGSPRRRRHARGPRRRTCPQRCLTPRRKHCAVTTSHPGCRVRSGSRRGPDAPRARRDGSPHRLGGVAGLPAPELPHRSRATVPTALCCGEKFAAQLGQDAFRRHRPVVHPPAGPRQGPSRTNPVHVATRSQTTGGAGTAADQLAGQGTCSRPRFHDYESATRRAKP